MATMMNAINANIDPVFTYHRFWAQVDMAAAFGTYALLNPEEIIEPTKKGSISGDINLDFAAPASIEAGFTVSILGGSNSAVTTSGGAFTISDVTAGNYSIQISKKGYLSKTIANITVADGAVTTVPAAVVWYGDIVADGALNMADIMIVAKHFNATAGSY